MNNKNFSDWIKWNDRDTLPGLKYPGIYVIARSSKNISNTSFNFLKEVEYIGMTPSQTLKARLKQFDDTIHGPTVTHGGADRMRFKHRNYKQLCKTLCFSPFN